ncbi:MAG TPA: N-formylglutamate amidohydrolase [Cyclobacteriaceae bacterium]|nr:N-formylglutamate amidohydrolase [Cyclobacteriaceae bacterium]
MSSVFRIVNPTSQEVPILLSIPHSGTRFPEEIRDQFDSTLAAAPDDTDWFVDTLYDFAPEMGITVLAANYSRWVIDLNRDPQSKPLYNDGRLITALCPTTTFTGIPLYFDQRKEVSALEVSHRIKEYFDPYHHQIDVMLQDLKARHGRVLLWDCHSIRRVVSTIHKDPFPDLILGDVDGTSASPGLIEAVMTTLDHSTYRVGHNHPFKGGYITRHFGQPANHQHALQLEMSKVNYMDDAEIKYHPDRSAKMRSLLKKNFERILETL